MANRKQSSKPDVIELFVSPEGDDSWSGRRPRPNARKTDGPFATVSAAQKAVRRLKKKALPCPVRGIPAWGDLFSQKASGFHASRFRRVYAEYQREHPAGPHRGLHGIQGRNACVERRTAD